MKFFIFMVLVALLGQSRANFDCSIVPGNSTVEIDDCSNFPVFINESIMTKCNNDFPATDDLPIGLCTAQCLLNATNLIYKETGKVNQQLFTDAIKSKSIGDWAAVAAAAVDTCYKLLVAQEQTIIAMMANQITSNPVCHPQSAVLISCLYTQLFINTPGSAFNQNSNAVCPDLREFVKNCAV